MTSPSSPSNDQAIRVTDHALERARQRHSDLRGLQERMLLRTICREVGEALRNERFAKTAPREVLRDEFYTRRGKAKWSRYAWNASRSRVYVLKRTAGVQLVVTVLSTVHSQP
jgi:hypothetical protein